jgi:hypothetical protein
MKSPNARLTLEHPLQSLGEYAPTWSHDNRIHFLRAEARRQVNGDSLWLIKVNGLHYKSCDEPPQPLMRYPSVPTTPALTADFSTNQEIHR